MVDIRHAGATATLSKPVGEMGHSRHYQLFVGGTWRDGSAGEVIDLINPATAEACGSVAKATDRDVDEAVAAAASGFETWRRKLPPERADVLNRACRIVQGSIEAIVRDFTEEQGKPLGEARGEMQRAAEMLSWTAAQCGRDFTRAYPADGKRRYTTPHPIGVVAALTPWNYPAVLVARKLGAALAAGCSVVLKAAEEVPAPAVAIVGALQEAGLPAGVVNLLFGDPPQISERLLASRAVRKLSFTGSTAVGKQLARLAADNLIRCTLELGGHAPVLVFEDADLSEAASAIAAYKFECAGQSCNAPSRIYVQDTVYDEFLVQFSDIAASIRVGDGTSEQTEMGPVQHERRLQAVNRLVADATAKGAGIVTGGARLRRPGYFVDPTVLVDVPGSATILHEEPFGPVVPVIPFSSLDDGLAKANHSTYGLAGYCFTDSAEAAAAVARDLNVGYVGINGLSGVPTDAPVGGLRDSGYGLEGGLEGIEDFLHPKLVTEVLR